MMSYTDVNLEGKQFNEWEVVTMKNLDMNAVKFLIQESLKEQPTSDDWLDSRYNEQVHWIGHTNPYYKLFYLLAKEFKPNLCVELGAWQCTASAHIAIGNPSGQVLAVDIHREDKDAQKRCYEAHRRLNNLRYINKWISDAVEDVRTYGKIDMLFCDGWHDFEHLSDDWNNYKPLLNDKALVIFDDITTAYNFEGMVEFWEQLEGKKFLNSDVHPGIPMGFLLWEKEVKKVGRPKKIGTSI